MQVVADAKELCILLRYSFHPLLDGVSFWLDSLLCARYSTWAHLICYLMSCVFAGRRSFEMQKATCGRLFCTNVVLEKEKYIETLKISCAQCACGVHSVHSVLITSVHSKYIKCAQCARCAPAGDCFEHRARRCTLWALWALVCTKWCTLQAHFWWAHFQT